MAVDLGKIAQTLEGVYNPSTIYNKLDTVSNNGSSYTSRIDNNNQPLTNVIAWQLTAEKGKDGVDGTNAQSFNFKGNVVNYSNLPTSGNIINDAYYNEADGLTYVYNGFSFPIQGKGLDFKGSNKIPIWSAKNWNQNDQVIKDYIQYIELNGADATDIPGESAKWKSLGVTPFSYKFKDDFDSNSGWQANATYPITPIISGGVMSLTLSPNSFQGIVNSTDIFDIGVQYELEIKYRIVNGGSGTKFKVGFNWGSEEATPDYHTLTPNSDWQISKFPITASQLTGKLLQLGLINTDNKGGMIEIDHLYVDKKEVFFTYSDILGNLDDSLNGALSSGNSVFLKPETYAMENVAKIPNFTSVKGVSGVTRILQTGNSNIFEFGNNSKNLSFEGIIFDCNNQILPIGMTADDIKSLSGLGTKNAILINGKIKNIVFKDCYFVNCNGWGIKSSFTLDLYKESMKISGNRFINNYGGVDFNTRSEYHQFDMNTFAYNRIGCRIDGGNNFGSTNHFNANSVGLVLDGSSNQNDTHGSLGQSTFNHNISYSMLAVNVNNGYTFNGCHYYDGKIYMENSTGIVIQGGHFDSNIVVVNERAESCNIISSNIIQGNPTIEGSSNKLSMYGNRKINGVYPDVFNNN